MHTPFFTQPKGLWERRGAPAEWIDLALDGAVRPLPNIFQQDEEGYTVWHYWANANHPETLWEDIRAQTQDQIDHVCAKNGEHPLHRLCLTGKSAAAQLWVQDARTPLLASMFLDTFWHSLAWNGNLDLFNTIAPHLDPVNINAPDESGTTPVMVACHRGNVDLIKAFLFFGADPNLCDEQKRALLHHVALYGDIALFTEMQDFGAMDDLRNDRGQTPRTILNDRMKHGTAVDFDNSRLHWEKRWMSKTVF